MLFPVYIHLGDSEHAHGVTIPDLPGCFSAADDWAELPARVQQSVELYFEGEDLDIPRPTPLEDLAQDPLYQDRGVWMLVDIDLSRLRPREVKVNLSLPASLVSRIDAFARTRHISRSRFLEAAARQALERELKKGRGQ